jgi:hypothetical protein
MNIESQIVSMMLCKAPILVNGRAVISASDAVWNPIENFPKELNMLTDDMGHKNPGYAGTVFTTSSEVVSIIQKLGIMLCMRGVRAPDIPHTDCPFGVRVLDLVPPPLFMGWDIVRGNGWVSASCDGKFPIDSTGEQRDGENASVLNDYSLFDGLDSCLRYCDLNNMEIPEWAPWYPVAVYCDSQTKSIIDALISS